MAVGAVVRAYYSVDGVTWNSVFPSINNGTLYDCCYGNGVSIAAGNVGIYYSHDSDLSNWTKADTSGEIYGIAWVEAFNKFVAVGQKLWTSPNGINWTELLVFGSSSNSLRSVVFGNGICVACGYNGKIIYSRNGSDWYYTDSGTINSLGSVMFGGGCFLAVSSIGEMVYSADGINWNFNNLTEGANVTALYRGAYDVKSGMFNLLGNNNQLIKVFPNRYVIDTV
jgi:hypothetical protein